MPTFGQAANAQQASPSPFGAQSTAVKPFSGSSQPAAGFSFGNTGTTGSLFGAPASSAPAFGGGLGGGFNAPSNALVPSQQPAAAPFSFNSQPQNAPALGMSPSGTSFQGTQQGAAGAQLPDDSAIRELQSIRESYVPAPGNSRYKFQYLFLNVVKDPAHRVKPNDIDELQWREALRRAGGPDNPQNLWPIPYNGFKGLLDRKAAQNEAVKEHKDRLEALQKSVAALANRHETVVRVQMEAIKARHQELSERLLVTLKYIDALEGRFSSAVGYDKATPRIVLQRLSEELRQMESIIAANSAQGLLGRVDSVASAARVQVGTPASGGQPNAEIDAQSLSQAFGILKDYSDAIAKMNSAVHRNARDIEIIKENSRHV